jgi:hypothetical protein
MPGLTPLVDHQWLAANVAIVELSSRMIDINSTAKIVWIPARVTNIATSTQIFWLELLTFFTGREDSVCCSDLILERHGSDSLGCVETASDFDRG